MGSALTSSRCTSTKRPGHLSSATTSDSEATLASGWLDLGVEVGDQVDMPGGRVQSFATEVVVQDGGVSDTKSLGWIGVGRMGATLVERLLRSGCDVSVYNRTRAKTEPLADLGAVVVDTPADLADRDIVITMVSSSEDLLAVTAGSDGVLSRQGLAPGCSWIARPCRSREGRRGSAPGGGRGRRCWRHPVSGNPKVARAGRSEHRRVGSTIGYELALPYLEILGRSVTYVGEGEVARLVKICHNLLLGIVAAALSEITVLAERGGVSRSDLLSFINDSVMGSVFTRYKTPAFVDLDFTPTFTGHLLSKDLELGLDAGERLGRSVAGHDDRSRPPAGPDRRRVRRSGLRVADRARSARVRHDPRARARRGRRRALSAGRARAAGIQGRTMMTRRPVANDCARRGRPPTCR